jgi:hypothetical protein
MLSPLTASALLLAHLAGSPSASPVSAFIVQDDLAPRTLFAGQYVGLSFELVDIDGKPRTLFPVVRKADTAEVEVAPAAPAPTTVVVFFSLYDPSSAIAVERLVEIQAEYAPGAVEIVLVDSNDDEIVSGSGDPLEKFRAWRDEKKVTLPVLIDRGNVVADRFGALCSNQVFVIDPARVLRYVGAIDDDPHGAKRAKNAHVETYLRNALAAVTAGTELAVTSTRPLAGRPIKRAPVAGVSR